MIDKIPFITSDGVGNISVIEFISKNCTIDNSDKLYHFTDLDSFIKIWLSKKLLFSERSRMNDIAEKCDMISGANKENMQIYLDAVREYKQLSFSNYKSPCGLEIYKSPLMWGFYGKKATGVCIEFDKEILLSSSSNIKYKDISYYEHIPTNSHIDNFDSYEINTIEDARKVVNEHIDCIYFSKYKEWEFENELRIISKTESFLDIRGSIKRIYLFEPESSIKEIVFNLVSSECEIKILFLSTIINGERYIDTYTLTESLFARRTP